MNNPAPLSVPTTLQDFATPSRTALLIYDMQVGIRRQVADADHIVERCVQLVTGARRAGMRVAYTQHLSMPRAWLGATQYRTAMAWQKTRDPDQVKLPFLRTAPAAAIVPELQPTEDDLVLETFSMSAFSGTALEFALRDAGLKALAIAGIALEIGIEPTVRHATDLGFVPIVISDACGSGNKEAAARSLETMRFVGEAILTETAAFLGALA